MSTSNGGYKTNEMFTMEFEINETPTNARTLLTKGYMQDEINSMSGICEPKYLSKIGILL